MSHLTRVLHSLQRVAVFGGVYSNDIALDAVLEDATRMGVDAVLCLGDLGGFGPQPDRAADRLRESDVVVIRGNYDESVGYGLDDCQCGYSDPRDNQFARISYDYTVANTSETNRAWFRQLPEFARFDLDGLRVLAAHGSPRRINEFLWESTTPSPFIRRLLDDFDCDLLLVTHTGLHWQRRIDEDPTRGIVNVGAIGRPANDGNVAIHYAIIESFRQGTRPSFRTSFRSVEYDHVSLSRRMRGEGLPTEFVDTILHGWWTSCLEVLPQKERARGRF